MADEYKPWIAAKVDEWSGSKVSGQENPRQQEPAPARELFAPARRVVSPSEARAAAEEIQKPKPSRQRPNYKMPE